MQRIPENVPIPASRQEKMCRSCSRKYLWLDILLTTMFWIYNPKHKAVLDLKPALKFNAKQKFYFNKQAKIYTKKELPYQVGILKNSTYLPLQE